MPQFSISFRLSNGERASGGTAQASSLPEAVQQVELMLKTAKNGVVAANRNGDDHVTLIPLDNIAAIDITKIYATRLDSARSEIRGEPLP